MSLELLKYPIGNFRKPKEINPVMLKSYVEIIEFFPAQLRNEVEKLSSEQLDWLYRPEGWSIRQVIHHCADSHMNSLIRFKLALTEENPTIKPYYEDRWSLLKDTLETPIEASLQLLSGLHQRWTILLKSFKESELERTFVHPEQGAIMRLDESIALYAWHCNHHLAHVQQAKRWKNKFTGF